MYHTGAFTLKRKLIEFYAVNRYPPTSYEQVTARSPTLLLSPLRVNPNLRFYSRHAIEPALQQLGMLGRKTPLDRTVFNIIGFYRILNGIFGTGQNYNNNVAYVILHVVYDCLKRF